MKITKYNINLRFMQIGIIIVIFFILIVSVTIYGKTYGYINATAKTSGGCGGTIQGPGCHGYVSTEVALDLSSATGSYTVEPNSITAFTIKIWGTKTTGMSGINIAVKNILNGTVDIGNLIPGPGLQLAFNELTHNGKLSMVDLVTVVTFYWQAPNTEGTYYMQAVGCAVNCDGISEGDFWNWMIPQALTVKYPAQVSITAPLGSEVWGAGTVHNITWTSTGFTNAKIELSSDGGITYKTTIAANVNAASGSYSWSIPMDIPTNNKYRIRVSDADFPQVNSSSPANFSIDGSPVITTQPVDQIVCEGGQVSFWVVASGIGMNYSWYKNSLAIPNATSTTYTIPKAVPLDDGVYTCVVTGAFGNPTTSNTATLNVTPIPFIVLSPGDNSVSENSKATISVGAIGPDLHYIWRKDGVVVSGQTNADLVFTSAKTSDNGDYDCIVWNSCGRDTSAIGKLIVSSNSGLTLKQSTINFDTVFVFNSKEILASGIVKNSSSHAINISKMTIIGNNAGDFTITEGDSPYLLNPLDSHSIRFKFSPNIKGQKTASIEFENDEGSSISLNLTGFAAQIELQAQETSIYYDTVMFNAPKTKSAMVKNIGNVDAKVTNLDFTGTNADRFEVIDPLPPFIIHADSTQEIKIQLTTKKKGLNEAILVIAADNLDSAYFIYLSGIGENPLSVEEDYISSAIKIYPNPANDALHFVLPQELVNNINIQIIDNLGKTVKKLTTNPFNTIEWNGIDDSGNMVPSGVYHAIINYSENIITREVVIIR